jgi:hypothetical protein
MKARLQRSLSRWLVALLAWPVLAATDVSGLWALEFETDIGGNLYRGECSFKQEGQKLSGSCSGSTPGSAPLPLTGDVAARRVTFQYKTGLGEGVTVTFTGELDEAESALKGTWRFVDQDGNRGTGTFTAQKH